MATLIQKADALAVLAHDGQFRRDGRPYITHPRAVAKIVQRWTSDPVVIAAALLHDSIEDSDGLVTKERIALEVSTEVSEVVALMTHSKSEPYMDYVRRLAPHPKARLVKRADLTHNLSDLKPEHKNYPKYQEALKLVS